MLGLLHVLGHQPGGNPFEEADRQACQMGEGQPGQPYVDPVRRIEQQIAAQEREGAVEQDRQHHAHDQHHQGRNRLVDQYPVHHELEEDRHRQRQHVNTSTAMAISRSSLRWRMISGRNQPMLNSRLSSPRRP